MLRMVWKSCTLVVISFTLPNHTGGTDAVFIALAINARPSRTGRACFALPNRTGGTGAVFSALDFVARPCRTGKVCFASTDHTRPGADCCTRGAIARRAGERHEGGRGGGVGCLGERWRAVCCQPWGTFFSSYEKNRDVRGPYGADSRVFRKKKLQACAGWVIYPGVAMKQCCGRRKGFGFATQSVVCKKNRFQGGHGSATFFCVCVYGYVCVYRVRASCACIVCGACYLYMLVRFVHDQASSCLCVRVGVDCARKN